MEVHAQRVPIRTIEPFSTFEDDDIVAKLHRAIEPDGAGRWHVEGDGCIPRLNVVEPCNADGREVGREGEIPLARLTAAGQIVLFGQRWRELQVFHLGGPGPGCSQMSLQTVTAAGDLAEDDGKPVERDRCANG